MVHYIYKITLLCGTLTGYYYIGKHSSKNNPLHDGYYGSGTIVKKYYKKYGKQKDITFIKEILEINETGTINAKREEEIIGNLWKTDPLCLNLKGGGEHSGSPHSEEWKKKISVSNKGKKWTEEQRKKYLKNLAFHKGHIPWNKGGHHSEEAKKKMSESHIGIQAGKNHPMYGKHHTEETKHKISEAGKGRVPYMKGKHHTEETKEKIRQDHIGKYTGKDNPNHIEVIRIDKKTGEEQRFDTITEAANVLNKNMSGISQCLHGKLKSAYGYIWKYA